MTTNSDTTNPTAIEQIPTIAGLRTRLDTARAAGKSIGFVPTMGFLHDGHASLIRAAAADNDLVVVSIFVNPLQFSATEDLSDYPRDLERDAALSLEAGASVLFTPSVQEMYPHGPVLTTVEVSEISARWEGASRPTHFAGVATVVSKLFSISGACRAYFGEKDFQQLAVIRRMVSDLSMPIEIVGCPIVRETDGLAMSSRNTYLEGAERDAATVLRRSLDLGLELISGGERDPIVIEAAMTEFIGREPLAILDYVAAVDAATLERPDVLQGAVRLLMAVKVGRPRLIDNDGTDLNTVKAAK